MSTYQFNNRFNAETRLELFDKYYLAVKERKLKRKCDFKLELAILNPEPQHVKRSTIHWLFAAGAAILVALYSLNLLLNTPANEALWPMLGATVGGVLLSALFIALYVLSIERKWVMITRTACHPLIEIPYHRKDKKRADQFVELLQNAIEMNIAEKGYNHEHLFAGEMRMLRRLAKNHVLTSSHYDRAKKHMLENGQMGLA
ncbi:MAG: hypothetical protein R6X15_04625 [Pseudomonadota bacterium]